MIIAGIDEAGRGPALGPMVLAVATIEKKDEEKLISLGVKDSKMLDVSERQRQSKELRGILSEFSYTSVEAKELDSLMDWKSLNEIEAMRVGLLLNNLKAKPDVVYVDSPDPKASNFARRIRKYISFKTSIKAEHKADVNYPIVSAASIIAKVERDDAITRLCEHYGELGSGYPHDPKTISFLCNWVKKNKCLPEIARKSWETNKNIIDGVFQKKIGEFRQGSYKNG